MASDQKTPPPGPGGMPEFDELQRGQEQPPSVETLERPVTPYRREAGQRETPVPDPGERPGAIRVDTPSPANEPEDAP